MATKYAKFGASTEDKVAIWLGRLLLAGACVGVGLYLCPASWRSGFIGLGLAVVLFLALRPAVCWYWKVTRAVASLDALRSASADLKGTNEAMAATLRSIDASLRAARKAASPAKAVTPTPDPDAWLDEVDLPGDAANETANKTPEKAQGAQPPQRPTTRPKAR